MPQHSAQPGRLVRVGLVSDTHGLVRPELEKLFHGVDAILHAGDVGSREVLRQLRRIAPVCAVAGNVDVAIPDLDLPTFECFTGENVTILVTHYIGEPDTLLPPVAAALAKTQARVVVSGHTHRPALHILAGRLFANPGAAGSRRFNLPVSCGLLTIETAHAGPRVQVQVIDLETEHVLLKETLSLGEEG